MRANPYLEVRLVQLEFLRRLPERGAPGQVCQGPLVPHHLGKYFITLVTSRPMRAKLCRSSTNESEAYLVPVLVVLHVVLRHRGGDQVLAQLRDLLGRLGALLLQLRPPSLLLLN